MMKEIVDIITAFNEAQRKGRQAALATVVHVEGSSYRRPGARMLVEDNGKMTGAISGGCLEGDALRKALLAINQGKNKLVTYNTLNKDDVEFGVQLGCNGIVHILFEPINSGQPNHLIQIIEKCLLQRQDAVLVTLFSIENFHGEQPGTCFLFNGKSTYSNVANKSLEEEIKDDALEVLAQKSSLLKQYNDYHVAGFVELIRPPVSLVIAGAGNDALPVVDIATVLGWQITIIDGRPTHANQTRFIKAHHIMVGKPPEVLNDIAIDERTVFILMTHNYHYDLRVMEELLQRNCRYIGTLGPKQRLQRMLSEMEDKGITITDEQRSVIYGPTGLDIGAETAEEIALSMLAEIMAVLTARNGNSLRERQDGIHTRSTSISDQRKNDSL